MADISRLSARYISNIFIPPTVMLLSFIYFGFRFETNTSSRIIVIVTALVFGFILPIIMFFFLRRKGRIVNSDATIKEERLLPFSIGFVFYSAGALILLLSGVNAVTQSFWLCYVTNSLIILVITKYWKISIHALGVSGPLAAIMYTTGLYSLPFFIILFLVGWSRIKLQVHTLAQVLAGSILGFASTYLQIHLLIKYILHVT